jgi:diguanylate cyclase (GGDEF)-like protein/PAS domain S-box-containing protein
MPSGFLRGAATVIETEGEDVVVVTDGGRFVSDHASDIVFHGTPDARVAWISPSVTEVLGFAPEDLLGRYTAELVHPDDRERVAGLVPSWHDDGIHHYRARFLAHDGAVRWMDVTVRAVRGGDGEVTAWVGAARDVTAEQRAVELLRESERRYRLLADSSTDAVLLSNTATDVVWVSPAAREVLGWDPEQLVGRRASDFIHPEDLPDVVAQVARSAETGEPVRMRYRWRQPGGTYRWVEAGGRPFVDDEGVPRRVVHLRDIDEQVRMEQELDFRATHDHLTGLLNRGEALSRLGALLDGAEDEGVLAVAYLDLDVFKQINDSHGHAAGDELLRATARRIEACVRADDVVGRIGGDELLVVLTGLPSVDAALVVAEKLRACAREPVDLPGRTISSTVSVGLAVAHPGESLDSLLARSDKAMYRAKESGGDAVRLAEDPA